MAKVYIAHFYPEQDAGYFFKPGAVIQVLEPVFSSFPEAAKQLADEIGDLADDSLPVAAYIIEAKPVSGGYEVIETVEIEDDHIKPTARRANSVKSMDFEEEEDLDEDEDEDEYEDEYEDEDEDDDWEFEGESEHHLHFHSDPGDEDEDEYEDEDEDEEDDEYGYFDDRANNPATQTDTPPPTGSNIIKQEVDDSDEYLKLPKSTGIVVGKGKNRVAKMKKLERVQASDKVTVYPKITDAAEVFGKFMAEYSPKNISPRLISGKYNAAMRKPEENVELNIKVQERKKGVRAAAKTIRAAVATGDFVGSLAAVHKKIVDVRAQLANKQIDEFVAAQQIAHWNKVFEILLYLSLFCPTCADEKPGSRDYSRYEELKDIRTRSEAAGFDPFAESTRSAAIAFQEQQERKARAEARRRSSTAAKEAPKPTTPPGESESAPDYSSLFGESGAGGGEDKGTLSPAKEDQIAWKITPDGMRALTDPSKWTRAKAQEKILKLLNAGDKSQAFLISSLGSIKDSINRLKNKKCIVEIQVKDMSEADLAREAAVRSGNVTIEQELKEGSLSTSARPAADEAAAPTRRESAKPSEQPKEEPTSGDLFGYKPEETKLDIDVTAARKAPEPAAPAEPQPKAAVKAILPSAEISDIEANNIVDSANESSISQSDLERIEEILSAGLDTAFDALSVYEQLIPYMQNETALEIPPVIGRRLKAAMQYAGEIQKEGKTFGFELNSLNPKDAALLRSDLDLIERLFKKITGSTIAELAAQLHPPDFEDYGTPAEEEERPAAPAAPTGAKYSNFYIAPEDIRVIRDQSGEIDEAGSPQEKARAAADSIDIIVDVADTLGNNALATQARNLSKMFRAQSGNQRLSEVDVIKNVGSSKTAGENTFIDLLYDIDTPEGNLGELVYGQPAGARRKSNPGYYGRHRNPSYSTPYRARKYYDPDFD